MLSEPPIVSAPGEVTVKVWLPPLLPNVIEPTVAAVVIIGSFSAGISGYANAYVVICKGHSVGAPV